jgi:GT2 family glycosyltransferase
MIRSEAFQDVGGFDEGYWNGYEDVDLCLAMGAKGWRIVYKPASVLMHHESASGAERFAKWEANVERLETR